MSLPVPMTSSVSFLSLRSFLSCRAESQKTIAQEEGRAYFKYSLEVTVKLGNDTESQVNPTFAFRAFFSAERSLISAVEKMSVIVDNKPFDFPMLTATK